MKNNWFLKFLIAALCIKFIFNSLIVSFIFAFILGAKLNDRSIPIKVFILGLFLGLESVFVTYAFTAHPGFAVFLGIFRTFNIPITNSIAYSTVLFISYAYIIVFEMIFVAFIAKFGESVQQFCNQHNIHFLW